MTADTNPIQRKELMKIFNNNLRAVKFIESLFDITDRSTTSEDQIVALEHLAGGANSSANQALAELQRIGDLLELISLIPREEFVSPDDLTPPTIVSDLQDILIDGGITDNTDQLIKSSKTLSDNAGGGAGTIANAPSAGDPSKWIEIDDNGTTRYIPTWT